MGAVRGLAAVSRGDGKLYVELEGSESGSVLLRVNQDGSTDPEFVAERAGRPLVVTADGGVICRTSSFLYSSELFSLDPRGQLVREFRVSADHFCCAGIMAVVRQSDDRLMVAGQFESINGIPRRNIARLNTDSTVDQSFDAGESSSRWIWRVAIQGDGKIIIAGEFRTVAGLPRAGIARLSVNGGVDESFVSNANPPTIFGGSGHGGSTALLVEPDGNILWSLQGGWTLPDSGIKSVVRLRSDGSLDTAFRPGNSLSAPDGTEPWIESIAVQADRKIILAGGFGPAGVARFLPDGSPDVSFVAGPSDGNVDAALLTPAGKLIILGTFQNYGGVERAGMASLFTEPKAPFQIIDMERVADREVKILVATEPGCRFTLEASDTLEAKTWQPLQTKFAMTNRLEFIDIPDRPRRFYRVATP